MTESSFDIAEPGKELLQWERIYNTVRPHQARAAFWGDVAVTHHKLIG